MSVFSSGARPSWSGSNQFRPQVGKLEGIDGLSSTGTASTARAVPMHQDAADSDHLMGGLQPLVLPERDEDTDRHHMSKSSLLSICVVGALALVAVLVFKRILGWQFVSWNPPSSAVSYEERLAETEGLTK